MIEVYKKKAVEKWFANNIEKLDALKFTCYRQVCNCTRTIGFVQEIFHTKLINLEQSEECIINNISKNCMEKIKKVRGKAQYEIHKDFDGFVEFYNSFSESRKVSKLSDSFSYYHDYVVLTKAMVEDEPVVMHSYLIDKNQGRARLLHSASFYSKYDNSKERNFIGMVNRFLHYRDIMYFKEKGFKTYDVGGYAKDSNDEKIKNINNFKDQYGGVLVKECNYISCPLFIVNKINSIIQ